MTNVWREFQKLIPGSRTIVVDVQGNNGDGTSTVTTQTGATVIVDGESVAAGNPAFVRDGEITGPAPDMPTYEETV